MSTKNIADIAARSTHPVHPPPESVARGTVDVVAYIERNFSALRNTGIAVALKRGMAHDAAEDVADCAMAKFCRSRPTNDVNLPSYFRQIVSNKIRDVFRATEVRRRHAEEVCVYPPRPPQTRSTTSLMEAEWRKVLNNGRAHGVGQRHCRLASNARRLAYVAIGRQCALGPQAKDIHHLPDPRPPAYYQDDSTAGGISTLSRGGFDAR